MASPGDGASGPSPFDLAVASLVEARATLSSLVRPELTVDETPAPSRIAPHAVALSAEVLVPAAGSGDEDEELGSGRFVLLHDPAGQEAWAGQWRVVTFVQASVEHDLGRDPLLPEVGWSWLEESLAAQGAAAIELGGSVTQSLSQGMGTLAGREGRSELEIRASWSPVLPAPGDSAPRFDLGPHLRAWATLLVTAAGLPPLPPGVAALPTRRR
ncbi:MAG: DUF3000 domain-containing protein [Actinomycetes bacterium]